MPKLIYLAITSLDGYIEDRDGSFAWAEPDEEVHTFVNDLVREVGTYLYGRRMYETMAVWETDPALAAGSKTTRDFAELWQSAEKVVFSRTLDAPSTERTRVQRDFEPEAIRRMKAEAPGDLAVGGAELAAHAFRAGLVDECQLFLAPVLVGGGKRSLPDGMHLDLELLDERSFAGGMVYLRYRAVPGPA
jgi:dihydrofolate reductase